MTKRSLDVRVVRETLQHRFVFQNRGGKLPHLDVRLGNPLGGAYNVRITAELRVGFLEDFQRLIVLRLRLSDDLKHLNRLHQLALFAGRQCAGHFSAKSSILGYFGTRFIAASFLIAILWPR